MKGSTAERMIDSCLDAMDRGIVSSRHFRDVQRCVDCPRMLDFVRHVDNDDPMIRGLACRIVARVAPEKVVECIIKEDNESAMSAMIQGIEEVKYTGVDDLTVMLRKDDSIVAERFFQMFVKVGRADLLFGLALKGDDETTARVRRYLDEQGWLQ